MSRKRKPTKKKKIIVKRQLSSTTAKMTKSRRPISKKSLAKWIIFFVWNAIALVSIIFSIWVVVTPRVFVYPAVPLDPNNPVFTPFVVRNEGYLDIHDVKFSCSMRYIKFPGKILAIGLGDYTNRFSDPKQVASVIAAGEECTELLPLSGLEHNQIENSDIAVVLTFKPIGWLPWRRVRLRRFVVAQSKDGRRYWLPQPIKK
ncbi:MAG: hypothetical protein ACYS67_08225 [Planctomycetota bacterium]|jgi:hypothetical protein